MRAALAAAAKANKQSTNAEVVARLEYSLSQTRTEIRTGMPLPEPGALHAAIQAIQFAMEHQKEIEQLFDKKGVEVPWARDDSKETS